MPLDARFSFTHEHFVAHVYLSCLLSRASVTAAPAAASSEFSGEANDMSGRCAEPGISRHEGATFFSLFRQLSPTCVVEALCIRSVTPSGVPFRDACGLIRTKEASLASERSTRREKAQLLHVALFWAVLANLSPTDTCSSLS